jgi:uncharacterized YkwD family protein
MRSGSVLEKTEGFFYGLHVPILVSEGKHDRIRYCLKDMRDQRNNSAPAKVRTGRRTNMKNRFVKITLILTMLLVMAVPAQAFAAEKTCTQNQSNGNNTQYSKIYDQLKQQGAFTQLYGALPQFQATKISTIQLQELFKQFGLKTANTASATPAAPATTTGKTPVASSKPAAPTSGAVTTPVTSALGTYEQQVVDLVNKERAAAGLSALKVNMTLAKVAETKAADLRDKNYFSHTSPTYGSPFDMMKQFGISYTAAGENIAKGQKTPAEVMNGWMNSPGHKANILNSKYTEIGVGYVTDGSGTGYWVQEFIRP